MNDTETLALARQVLESEHPVMAALAASVSVSECDGARIVLFVFDGPALPEKQNFELQLPTESSGAEKWTLGAYIAHGLKQCEVQLAAVIRKAGLGGK